METYFKCLILLISVQKILESNNITAHCSVLRSDILKTFLTRFIGNLNFIDAIYSITIECEWMMRVIIIVIIIFYLGLKSLSESYLRKSATGRIVKIKKKVFAWPFNIVCGSCSKETMLRVDAKTEKRIDYFQKSEY